MRLTDIKPIRRVYGWICRKHAAYYTGSWIDKMREKHSDPLR